MSISIDKLINRSNTAIQPLKNSGRQSAAEPVGKKFDEVLISSSATQIQEKKITEAMERSVLSQIKAQSSSGNNIEELKKSVEDGTYRINPEEIASRILLEGGIN